jgi:hypothetical protein
MTTKHSVTPDALAAECAVLPCHFCPARLQWELFTGGQAYQGERTADWGLLAAACTSDVRVLATHSPTPHPPTARSPRSCHAAGIPRALVGHKVAVLGLRPTLPPFTPPEYRSLVEDCWHGDPDKRCVALG